MSGFRSGLLAVAVAEYCLGVVAMFLTDDKLVPVMFWVLANAIFSGVMALDGPRR